MTLSGEELFSDLQGTKDAIQLVTSLANRDVYGANVLQRVEGIMTNGDDGPLVTIGRSRPILVRTVERDGVLQTAVLLTIPGLRPVGCWTLKNSRLKGELTARMKESEMHFRGIGSGVFEITNDHCAFYFDRVCDEINEDPAKITSIIRFLRAISGEANFVFR